MGFLKVPSRRVKFWSNLAYAYIARYRFWALGIFTAVLVLTLAISEVWPVLFRNNVLAIGYVGSYKIGNIPSSVLNLATQSLIVADTSGRPQPQLASHWTVSQDGKTYIVFLKENLEWHDGTKLNAKDISIAISNVDITAVNNKTIEFKLPNPISSFPLALDKPIFKTKSFYGTGEFRITDIDEVDNIVKKISLVSKDKRKPKVDIKFYQSEEQAREALRIGEIKSASVSDSKIFEHWKNLDVQKNEEESEIVTIFYNTQDPLLSSKDFRQALSFAINRFEFEGKIATGPISPSSWANNESVKKYEYNTSKAKELLERSESKNPKLTLSVTAGLEKLAESIKKDWQSIGIEVELKFEKNIPASYQALLAVNKLTPDPDQYSLWHSSQTETNITKLKDVKIDKLLEDARNTTDEGKRKELYFDFQKFLTEDAPATFLYHPYKYNVTYKNAKDLIEKLPKF